MHESAPRSIDACNASVCARLRTDVADCCPDRARSGRCCAVGSGDARDPSRSRDRRSPAPVFAAVGLSSVGRGLLGAWLPRALATLGFTDSRAPFLAGTKLPSRKASSQRSRPSWSSPPNSVRQACNQIPSLPTAAAVANRWTERETLWAGNATPHRFAEFTKCPRNTLGSTLAVAHDCLVDAAGEQAMVLSTPTHRSTASVAPS